MEFNKLTISQLHDGFKQKKFTSTQITKIYLDVIKKTDEQINSYLTVSEKLALEQAEKADEIITKENNFPLLCGIPCSIKDAILVKNLPCTAGSRILENYTAPYDATVIKKLKAQGAVILGKTNLDEFAMGVSTENSSFKVSKNPYDLTRVAGGSSGGSASSVAANQAVYSLGSDTGGSIRLPASFCGLVGLNPTYGSVSRYGLIALASSLDQIGPITKNVQDCKTVFKVISGRDDMDATSVDYKFTDEVIKLSDLRIGIPKEYFSGGIDFQVKKIIENAIQKAEDAGAKIVEISLPTTKYAIADYYVIVTSEASANLARYDGIRYGKSIPANNLQDVYTKSRGKGFGTEVKRRIMLGTFNLSSGYYEAYYKKAQEVRELIIQDFQRAFQKVDVIFSPTAPFTAFKIGEKSADPLAMYLVDVYTSASKLAGLPAISLPAGKVDKLPVGLQIIAGYFQENKIIAIAEIMEKML